MADALTTAQIRSILERHPDLRGAAQYIAKDGSNTTTSVMIFVQQAIREVFAGAFRQVGDFSARQFIREKGGRALFLEYDVSPPERLRPRSFGLSSISRSRRRSADSTVGSDGSSLSSMSSRCSLGSLISTRA